jgi:hypothetical protein
MGDPPYESPGLIFYESINSLEYFIDTLHFIVIGKLHNLDRRNLLSLQKGVPLESRILMPTGFLEIPTWCFPAGWMMISPTLVRK